MRLRLVLPAIALPILLSACGAVEDYLAPTPTPTRTCYDGRGDDGYDAMKASEGVPNCPTPTRRPQLTDAEIDQQWEDGERERDREEQQYRQEAQYEEGGCLDVTSYDNNWSNDVLCTRSDGSQFYTDYDGANRFLAGY